MHPGSRPHRCDRLFRYNGLTFERFVWAFLKSQVLCAGPRVYRAENIYLQAMPEQRKIWGAGKKP